jgi:hypothetical protein
LVPIPNGIEISEEKKSQYRDQIWNLVEKMAGEKLLEHIEYEQIFDV